MIRVIYEIQTKNIISLVDTSDGTTVFNLQGYGMLQGNADEIIIQAVLLNLSPQPIIDYLQSHNNIPMSEEMIQVLRDRAFGQLILNEFLALRRSAPSTPEEDLALMNTLQNIREMLYDGSIKSARLLLQNMQGVIPDELKTYFVNKMNTYLDGV